MYLEEIIENVQMESDKFECKAKLNRDDWDGSRQSLVLQMHPVEILISA